MTDVERRFETSYREADTDEPGLVLEDDGTIWQVAPGGARTQIGTANGGSQPVLVASTPVTLTSPQLLALDTTPVTVVPAPGAGKIIMPLAAACYLHAGATPYAGDGGALQLFYIGEATSVIHIFTTDVVNAAADAANYETANDGTAVPAASSVNKGLEAKFATPVTDGNGTLTVTVYYVVFTV